MAIAKAALISMRREKVLEFSAQGLTHQEIADKLMMSQRNVSNDLSYLRQQAITNIKEYVEQRLPFEFMRSLKTLDYIKKRAFKLADKTDIDDRNKIASLRLAAETEVGKCGLLSEGPSVIALQDIQDKVNRLESYQFSQSIRRSIPVTA